MLVVCYVDPLKTHLNNYTYKYDSPREMKSVLLPLFVIMSDTTGNFTYEKHVKNI